MTHKTPVNASAVEEELKGLPERVLERTKLIYPAYDHLMLMDGFKTDLRWQVEAILKDEVEAILAHASTSDSTLREVREKIERLTNSIRETKIGSSDYRSGQLDALEEALALVTTKNI